MTDNQIPESAKSWYEWRAELLLSEIDNTKPTAEDLPILTLYSIDLQKRIIELLETIAKKDDNSPSL